MSDPTYGRIDPDIQRTVDEIGPKSLGQRVAMENTLQERRNRRWAADADGPFKVDAPPSQLVSQPGKRSRWDLNSRFVIGQPGNPMMERWRLLQTPWFGIYVHFIHREDLDPIPHDHPWQFRSFVLRGGYSEEFYPDARVSEGRAQTFGRWSFHRFPLAASHRITSVRPGTVTLVIVGRKRRTWGFWHVGRFTDYRDALGLRPQEGDPRKRPRDGEANDPPVLVDHGAPTP